MLHARMRAGARVCVPIRKPPARGWRTMRQHHLSWIVVVSAIYHGSQARTAVAEPAPPGMLDLSHAVVVAPSDLTRPEKKAIALLVAEVRRRSGVAWSMVPRLPDDGPAIVVGQDRALRAG